MKKTWFVNFWKALKLSFTEFGEDKGAKLSASLAYYTIFSIPPLLIIIIALCGLFFEKEALEGKVYAQISGLVGSDAAIQIQETIKHTGSTRDSKLANTIGAIALIFGASGVFAEIQDSINFIWGLKPKPKKGFIKMILNRLISFSLVITIGFLLMVSLVVSALMDLLNQRLQRYFPVDSYYIFYALNILLIFVVISFLFATIFKILPDGKLKWKNVMSGSIFTALLFMIGKFGLSYYIGQSHIGSSYGAAGSIIIILVWVYYSSMILYFGAVFTQVYARIYGQKLVPNSYAVLVEQIQIEKEISDNSRKVPAEAGQN